MVIRFATHKSGILFVATAVVSLLAAAPDGMVSIPGGAFQMGNVQGAGDERPVHQVTISPFFLDKTEVTYGDYGACVRAGRCRPAHYDDGLCLLWSAPSFRKVRVPERYRSPDFPVVCVSWDQSRDYCRYVGKRLPTEAEWEYAARAGGMSEYPWGSGQPTPNRCVMSPSRCPARVGARAAGSWGLFDMIGNVWEWTNDRYQRDYYTESSSRDPQGPDVGRYRVIRGGGWYSDAAALRTSNRLWFSSSYGEASIGFRCAK